MKPSLQAVDVGLLLPRFGLVEKLIRVKIKPVYQHIRDETRKTDQTVATCCSNSSVQWH